MTDQKPAAVRYIGPLKFIDATAADRLDPHRMRALRVQAEAEGATILFPTTGGLGEAVEAWRSATPATVPTGERAFLKNIRAIAAGCVRVVADDQV